MSIQPLTDDERADILAALRAGESRRAVAARFSRSVSTVSLVGQSGGCGQPERSISKGPTRRDYDAAARVELLNEGFDKAHELLSTLGTAHKLQAWAIAVGILIDKRRLEDGEATSRDDVVTSGARDRIARRLDELAARRDTLGATG